jgi:hypothetical protein
LLLGDLLACTVHCQQRLAAGCADFNFLPADRANPHPQCLGNGFFGRKPPGQRFRNEPAVLQLAAV